MPSKLLAVDDSEPTKIVTYVPERTCKIETAKNGPLYFVYRFSCCGYEFSESKTDGGASELADGYCPNCGAKVTSE